MFTGIVTDLGNVVRIARDPAGAHDTRLDIETAYDGASIPIGASVACNGACLTVVETTAHRFSVEASDETLNKTTIGDWSEGTKVNLERALGLGDELGGHLVTGHVDGIGTVVSVTPVGEDSARWVFQVSDALGRAIAPKGSVAIDGVSLTVNEVEDVAGIGTRFSVNIIRHTREVTNFGHLGVGDRVNVEIDLIARYVQRLLQGDR
ncbi:MAG: riboflavin synthase [Alphaproteobacteria bacterium]|nr:riboflavin synthase [Alphaproteobacteria bacterium]